LIEGIDKILLELNNFEDNDERKSESFWTNNFVPSPLSLSSNEYESDVGDIDDDSIVPYTELNNKSCVTQLFRDYPRHKCGRVDDDNLDRETFYIQESLSELEKELSRVGEIRSPRKTVAFEKKRNFFRVVSPMNCKRSTNIFSLQT